MCVKSDQRTAKWALTRELIREFCLGYLSVFGTHELTQLRRKNVEEGAVYTGS